MKPPRNLDTGLPRTFAAIADHGGFALKVVIPAYAGIQRRATYCLPGLQPRIVIACAIMSRVYLTPE